MRINLKLLLAGSVFTFVFMLLCMPRLALAHILVADSSNTAGAVLHVTPEDDPVAGETTGIYYEVGSKIDLKSSKVSLIISSDTGGINLAIPVTIHDQTVSAGFNFPVRGLYFLTLRIAPNEKTGKEIVFTSSQRVTHSLKGANPAVEVPTWARAGLILSVWAVLLLLLVAIKRRRLIAGQSK